MIDTPETPVPGQSAIAQGGDPHALLMTLAERLGIPFRPTVSFHTGDDIDEALWDGNALQEIPDAGDLAHEIAHWLVADPARRRLINYGLGRDWQAGGVDEPCVPSEQVRAEEHRASVLGILLEHRCGGSWQATWLLHNWCWEADDCERHTEADIGCSGCTGHAFLAVADTVATEIRTAAALLAAVSPGGYDQPGGIDPKAPGGRDQP